LFEVSTGEFFCLEPEPRELVAAYLEKTFELASATCGLTNLGIRVGGSDPLVGEIGVWEGKIPVA